jgi:RHS repeat-associated protein
MLDQSGGIIARFAFNAWGKLVNPQTGLGHDPKANTKEALTTLGYTGHEELWAAGLVHTWARLYNPAIGRWLSPDPTVPNAYNGQSFNRYSYVLNNPLTLTDPLGLCANDPGRGNCDTVTCPDDGPKFCGCTSAACTGVMPGGGFLGLWGGGGRHGPGLLGVGYGAPISCIKAFKSCGNHNNPHKKKPCGGGSMPWYKAIYKVPINWILQHGFAGASARGTLPLIGSVGPTGGLHGEISDHGLSGGLGVGPVGTGFAGDAVAGFQFGTPSQGYLGFHGIFQIWPWPPIGIVVNSVHGSNGQFTQVGVGFVAGEHYSLGPSAGVSTGESKGESASASNTNCPSTP